MTPWDRPALARRRHPRRRDLRLARRVRGDGPSAVAHPSSPPRPTSCAPTTWPARPASTSAPPVAPASPVLLAQRDRLDAVRTRRSGDERRSSLTRGRSVTDVSVDAREHRRRGRSTLEGTKAQFAPRRHRAALFGACAVVAVGVVGAFSSLTGAQGAPVAVEPVSVTAGGTQPVAAFNGRAQVSDTGAVVVFESATDPAGPTGGSGSVTEWPAPPPRLPSDAARRRESAATDVSWPTRSLAPAPRPRTSRSRWSTAVRCRAARPSRPPSCSTPSCPGERSRRRRCRSTARRSCGRPARRSGDTCGRLRRPPTSGPHRSTSRSRLRPAS